MAVEAFGSLEDGGRVERAAIAGGGLAATILTWGAVIQDLRLEGHPAPLVLGFDAFRDYLYSSPHFGAIVGRVANRIRNGRFEIDGETHQADRNFLGKHMLHGGARGMGGRPWRLVAAEADRVVLSYRAEDGEMGFPGALDAVCSYRLSPVGRLEIALAAECDAPTLCNLAHHSYFNLDDGGRSSALAHRLQIDAAAYLPVDDELIPSGAVTPVAGTRFDFRDARPIGAGGASSGYDHNFCLSAARAPLRRVAEAHGARSGVAMEVWTTEPGLQFYDGARVGRAVPGLGGVRYGAHAGLCLEPQIWPDAPSHPHFPQALLRPGERYEQTTEYRFRFT